MQWVYEQAVDRYKQKRWFMGGTRVFHPVPCGHCVGLPVSHGCVRLSPAHAATLFNLVKAEGMNQTTIVVSGHTPAGSLELVSRRAPVEQASTQPLESASGYGARSLGSYDTQAYYRQQQIYYPPHPTLVDQLLRLFSPN